MTFDELYAVPGRDSIIDGINPDTGLTLVYGRTEADVLTNEPGAVRMTWETWREAQAARQNTPIHWRETTEAQYREMLNILPPAAMLSDGFLVGEPCDHCVLTGRPRFRAYRHFGRDYVGAWAVSSRPMTVAEFRKAVSRI